MKSIEVVFILASLLGNAYSQDPAASDLKAALDFIRCCQEAIITGIPEAGIPGHDPLIFNHNDTYHINLGDTEATLHLNNMQLDGTPWWNVTEAVQEVTEDTNSDVFKFTIYWPLISFSVNWELDTNDSLTEVEYNGTFYLEFDHVDFHIDWKSTKPQEGRNGTLDAFTLDIQTKEAHVNVTNLGYVGDLINAVGGDAAAYVINHNPIADQLSEQLKNLLVTRWVNNPNRIDAINSHCSSQDH